MKQIYHSNATANVKLRTEISKSNATNLELSEKYDISLNTVEFVLFLNTFKLF